MARSLPISSRTAAHCTALQPRLLTTAPILALAGATLADRPLQKEAHSMQASQQLCRASGRATGRVGAEDAEEPLLQQPWRQLCTHLHSCSSE